ncbi:MAG: hypothetical protein PHT94_04795 [Candidatus Nanoarchaeia archaeon]|nr:hypothetical protein [Candidatus Nanoarchaeia archaeon]
MAKLVKKLFGTIFSVTFQILVVLLIVSILMNVAINSIERDREKTLEELYETTTEMISSMNVDQMNVQTNYSLYKNYQLIPEMGIDETKCSDFVSYIDNWALESQANYIEQGVFVEFDDIIDQILNYSKNSNDTKIYDVYTNCKNDSNFYILEYFKPQIRNEFEKNLVLSKEALMDAYGEQIDSLLENIKNSWYLKMIMDYVLLGILVAINLAFLYMANGFNKTNLSIGINILFTGALFIVFNVLFSSADIVSKFFGSNISQEIMESVTNLSFYTDIMRASQNVAIAFLGVGAIMIGLYFIYKKRIKVVN